jgi:hypothetical protein
MHNINKSACMCGSVCSVLLLTEVQSLKSLDNEGSEMVLGGKTTLKVKSCQTAAMKVSGPQKSL